MTYAGPLLFTIFAWWFSTGLILYLDGRPQRTFKWTFLGATLLAGLGFAGLRASSAVETPAAAYCAFACALLIWAWQEVAFLLGFVTGPRRSPCPVGSSGWQRAGFAAQTLLHHELALLVLGCGVVAATWGGANPTGVATFAILWVMRQSAKLNVFLGVRNLNAAFLPSHLAYLATYFRQARMNSLFPISVVASTWFAVLLWQAAAAPGVQPFDATALSFAGALLSLAILEHWFMVLPLASEALWGWGLRASKAGPARDLGTTPS